MTKAASAAFLFSGVPHSGRDAIEVSLPFVLTVAGRSLTWARLSLQQVTVETDMRAMPEGD